MCVWCSFSFYSSIEYQVQLSTSISISSFGKVTETCECIDFVFKFYCVESVVGVSGSICEFLFEKKSGETDGNELFAWCGIVYCVVGACGLQAWYVTISVVSVYCVCVSFIEFL